MAYEMMLYPTEKTPQTVPAAGSSYTSSDLYASYAELFDLSLVPNDGEVPLSPQQQSLPLGPSPAGSSSPEYIPATIFHDVPAGGPMHQLKQEHLGTTPSSWSDTWSVSSGYLSCGSVSNPGSPESPASSYGLLDHPHHQQWSAATTLQPPPPPPYEQQQTIKSEYESGPETSIDLESLLGDAPSPYPPVPATIVKLEPGAGHPYSSFQSAGPSPPPPQDTGKGFQILREHLQDTSFQRRHNLKPLELDSLIGGLTTHADIRPVFEFALQEVKATMQAICTELGISSDPKQWSTVTVHQWLNLAMGKYSLPRLDNLGRLFPENGAQLAALPLEEFVRRIPQGGHQLHGYLELWLMEADSMTSAMMMVGEGITGHGSTLQAPGLQGVAHFPGTSGSGAAATIAATATSPAMMVENFDSDSASGDASDDDDEDMPLESPGSSSSAGGGGRSGTVTTVTTSGPTGALAGPKPRQSGSHIHLWQFLKELLAKPEQNQNAIRWIDRQKGVFKIEDSVRVARLWGLRKNRPAMNYDKLSRSIRQYYKKGIMQKTERSQRLVYQFCAPYAL
ncbi:DNA-binding protein D-ETS-4 [Anopheles cruzii]|uniref:DNA-binding protein D-ETS-4 n=1 Tax=Anopheles cruzii TaxID=68878 RepID=UPI0022EC4B08|nr:DNA-binding protein D-ETS-4 [Anopheles cruzii]